MLTDGQKGLVKLRLDRKDGFTLDVNFEFPETGITVVFGESGSGKTTVLRCVAGLETGKGFVSIGDDVWQDDEKSLFLPTWQRSLGYVFQEASLFPHLTAKQNIEFAVKRSHSKNALQRMEVAIDLLGIRHLLGRRPAQLSGGERQRVAIARAVATEPKIMLFDEPLAALDFARKSEILPWLEKLRDELKIPMLYVTHSAEEVMRLADNLVVLEKGKLIASGPVQEVLSSVKVPIEIGGDTSVVLKGHVIEKEDEWHLAKVQCGDLVLTLPDTGLIVGQKASVRVLAKEVAVSKEENKSASVQNVFEGVITEIAADKNPSDSLIQINCSGQYLLSKVTTKAVHDLNLQVGSKVYALFKAMSAAVS